MHLAKELVENYHDHEGIGIITKNYIVVKSLRESAHREYQ